MHGLCNRSHVGPLNSSKCLPCAGSTLLCMGRTPTCCAPPSHKLCNHRMQVLNTLPRPSPSDPGAAGPGSAAVLLHHHQQQPLEAPHWHLQIVLRGSCSSVQLAAGPRHSPVLRSIPQMHQGLQGRSTLTLLEQVPEHSLQRRARLRFVSQPRAPRPVPHSEYGAASPQGS